MLFVVSGHSIPGENTWELTYSCIIFGVIIRAQSHIPSSETPDSDDSQEPMVRQSPWEGCRYLDASAVHSSAHLHLKASYLLLA